MPLDHVVSDMAVARAWMIETVGCDANTSAVRVLV